MNKFIFLKIMRVLFCIVCLGLVVGTWGVFTYDAQFKLSTASGLTCLDKAIPTECVRKLSSSSCKKGCKRTGTTGGTKYTTTQNCHDINIVGQQGIRQTSQVKCMSNACVARVKKVDPLYTKLKQCTSSSSKPQKAKKKSKKNSTSYISVGVVVIVVTFFVFSL